MPTATLRPRDFVERLAVTGLTVAGYPQPVRIRRYLCRNTEYGGNARAEALRVAVTRLAATDPVTMGVLTALRQHRALDTMTNGQGHPETMARFMAIVWEHRAALAAVRNERGEEWLRTYFAAPNPLEAMADGLMFGLDCIGFVGRYMQAAGVFRHYNAWYPRNYPDTFLPVARAEDVQALCVLVWVQGSHVAVIDEVIDCVDGRLLARICQSSTGGPQTNERVWLSPCDSQWLEFGNINRAYREAANQHRALTHEQALRLTQESRRTSDRHGYRGGLFFNVSLGSPVMPVTGHVYIGKLPGLRRTWDQAATPGTAATATTPATA